MKFIFGKWIIILFVAWVFKILTQLPFLVILLLIGSALFINGWIADREDKAPGGLENPIRTPKKGAKKLPHE